VELNGGMAASGGSEAPILEAKRRAKYPLPEVVRGFKTFAARRINELQGIQGVSVWQRNYWEHIVRNEEELQRIREYIRDNPVEWEKKHSQKR
jgi:REP element-mobilizing transposase RayT